jgi:hypothetical protein
VGNLFASFDFDQLPNVVNMPAYERLCAFLRDLKRAELVPPALSVRAVVEAIKKFNTSGTLCWLLARDPSGSRTAQAGLGDFGATQRVFAHCAPAIFAKVVAAAMNARVNPVTWQRLLQRPCHRQKIYRGQTQVGTLLNGWPHRTSTISPIR